MHDPLREDPDAAPRDEHALRPRLVRLQADVRDHVEQRPRRGGVLGAQQAALQRAQSWTYLVNVLDPVSSSSSSRAVRTLHASGTASAPTMVEPLKRYDTMTQARYCKALADEWGPPVELEGINEQSTPGTIYKTVLDRAHMLFPSRDLPTADTSDERASSLTAALGIGQAGARGNRKPRRPEPSASATTAWMYRYRA